jgi:hypothetical protein
VAHTGGLLSSSWCGSSSSSSSSSTLDALLCCCFTAVGSLPQCNPGRYIEHLAPSPSPNHSFSGLQPVAGFGFGASAAAAAAAAATTAAASSGASAEPVLPGQLDGDVAQCLRHLSKKDATTKLKALQSLRELIPARSPSDLAGALPPWAYHFKRLMMDPAKSVRSEACATMGALAGAVGKQLAPQLRQLLPPWWLATFDPYADVAAAARRSLAEVFPGPKQAGSLVFCRWVLNCVRPAL